MNGTDKVIKEMNFQQEPTSTLYSLQMEQTKVTGYSLIDNTKLNV